MTGQNLTDLLERAAERTHVGPPPLERMLARHRHLRRRRTAFATAAASVAVVAVVGGTSVYSGPGSSPEHDTGPAGTSSSPVPTEDRRTASPDNAKHDLASTGLNGTWTVRALVGRDGKSVLPAPYADKVQMTFNDGEMRGNAGCNEVWGTYKASGDRGEDLVFPRAQLTSYASCDEAPLVTRLLDVRHVSGSGDVRYLHAENWMIVAELHRRSPSDWHTVEYGQIAFDVPPGWTLDSADPCTGEAIVSPPRVRTSCPPQPSALIIRSADDSPRKGAPTVQVAVGDFVVRLTGVDAKTAQTIIASVRTR